MRPLPALRSYRAAATAAVLGSMVLASPVRVTATPAYARRYAVSCSTCHSPLPPRLNNLGMVFRRLGFRMPDADDEGRLVVKPVPSHGIGDAASLSANTAYRHDNHPEEGAAKSSLELGEVELVAGTAVGSRLSTQMMFLPWNDDGEVELEDLEAQLNAGSARHQFTARAGLMQTFYWQKANHEALTLSAPLLFGERAVQGVGDFGGFSLGAKQIGTEAGYLFTRLKDGRLSSTMASVAVYNGVNAEGERAIRNTAGGFDVLAQAVELFGQRNTLGAFYYDGRTALEAGSAEPVTAPIQHFRRYGVMGNYLLFKRIDLVASAVQGRDRLDPENVEVRMRGLFAEADVEIAKRWVGVYRFDAVDPDLDVGGDVIRAHTLSCTFQAEDHLYLTAEYRRLHRPDLKDETFAVNARLIY